MCHFYANPLSIFASGDCGPLDALQAEHLEAIRNTPSFRSHVERAVESGTPEDLSRAQSLIEDDEFLVATLQEKMTNRAEAMSDFLRALLIVRATGTHGKSFLGPMSTLWRTASLSRTSRLS